MATETATLLSFPARTPPQAMSANPREVGLAGSTPLRLDSEEAGWLVRNGRVDLFAVVLRNGEPAGTRHPLGQIAAGGLILGLPYAAGHAIIAVGRLDTVICPLTRDQLDACPVERLGALIESWIARICGLVFGDAPAWPETVAEAGAQLELAAGARLYAPLVPVWVVPRSGLLSAAEVEIDLAANGSVLPIAAGLSVKADTAARVDLISTADAVARGYSAVGLERLHAVILTAVGERIARAGQAEQLRLDARAAADYRSTRLALSQLAGVAGVIAGPAEAAVASDLDVAAFVAVAAAQEIELPRRPRTSISADSTVSALARANRIGMRWVLLRDNWWRGDNGPLLASRGQPGHGVALLPVGRRHYRLWDPADGSSVAVDACIAATIAPEATMIYRTLPPRIRGIGGLMRFAWSGNGKEVASIIAAGALAGAVAALVPVATGFLFEAAVPRADAGQVLAVILGLTVAALGAGIFDLTAAIALLRLTGRLDSALQPALMQRMLGLPVNFFRGFGTGELTNRVLAIQSIRRVLAGKTLLSLLSALFAVSSFLVIFVYSPLLAIVSGTLVGAAATVDAVLSVAELRQERARVALLGQEESLVVQLIQGIAKLRVAASEHRVFAIWAALLARQKRHYLSGRRFAASGEIFQEVYPLLAMLVVFFVASRLILGPAGEAPALSLGGFLAVNAAFGQLLVATGAMARALAASLEVVPLFERLRPIVTAEPEARDDKREVGRLSGRIEASHASFRYAEGSRPVLDDLSLRIEPGEFVALVGPSGSGKSTLLRLLLGFETPKSGDILFDGQSIRTLDTASLRRQIGVVLQHGRIGTGSIFENITSSLPYSLADAWTAARLAGIDADIEAMPMGMHTLLIEGVTTLSGGQRQRLMIARSLIGKPSILLFDEATSALDNHSQALVTQSLEQLRTTRIVVAHRLSTIERADRIFVLEQGRLVETGNFSELMAQNGLFSRLARRQML